MQRQYIETVIQLGPECHAQIPYDDINYEWVYIQLTDDTESK